MRTWGKQITLALVTFFFTLILLIPLLAEAQITGHYGKSSDPNLVAYDLTIYRPSYQGVYSNKMPLDFNLTWTYDLMPLATLNGAYTYRIDNNSPVNIASNQSANSRFAGGSSFEINPKFSYLIDVSNLTNGHHLITISATLYWQFGVLLNESAAPVQFIVQNTTPSPTPTVPEFPTLAILLISLLIPIVLVFRLQKKNSGNMI